MKRLDSPCPILAKKRSAPPASSTARRQPATWTTKTPSDCTGPLPDDRGEGFFLFTPPTHNPHPPGPAPPPAQTLPLQVPAATTQSGKWLKKGDPRPELEEVFGGTASTLSRSISVRFTKNSTCYR